MARDPTISIAYDIYNSNLWLNTTNGNTAVFLWLVFMLWKGQKSLES